MSFARLDSKDKFVETLGEQSSTHLDQEKLPAFRIVFILELHNKARFFNPSVQLSTTISMKWNKTEFPPLREQNIYEKESRGGHMGIVGGKKECREKQKAWCFLRRLWVELRFLQETEGMLARSKNRLWEMFLLSLIPYLLQDQRQAPCALWAQWSKAGLLGCFRLVIAHLPLP